ncbi:MAG: cell division protein FtsZ [Rhodospirillales bacterium]|nr:cell division protein FtsZ [Rhodospirillales bacterium]
MSLNLTVPLDEDHSKPRITVIGIGGAGGNAVNNMIASNLSGVEFLVCNTDAQALTQSSCQNRLQLGRNLTRGLGAGARPDIGQAAAEEALDEIMGSLDGCNMVFITAGMGGGTGTGAAPVIARAAREQGILTVGVVTKPFHFEGVHRMRLAESGMQELTQTVDTLIIIPNQNLFRIANEKTTFADAFKMADDVLEAGVRGVTDLMVLPGLINLDFNDIRTVMTEMGKAMMGTGEADGEGRATQAAEAAIANPLLDDVSMRGARGVLINITGGPDLTLFEVDEAANKIREQVDPEANIIFGSTFDQTLEGKMRVSIVATGIDAEAERESRPGPSLSLISNPKPQSAQAPASRMPSHTAMSPPMAAPAPTARSAAVPNMTAPAITAQPRLHGSATLATQIEPQEELLDLVEPAVKAEDQAKKGGARFENAAELEAKRQAEKAERFIAEIEAREEAFIAPRPLVAERPVEMPTRSRPEPFREALSQQRSEQAKPAPAAPEPRRSPGLIKRMTGLFHSSQQAEQAPEPSPARTATPSAPQRQAAPRAEASVHHQMPERSIPHPQAANPGQAPAAQQTRLNLEEGRRAPRISENQMLDIPAFLRRQLN